MSRARIDRQRDLFTQPSDEAGSAVASGQPEASAQLTAELPSRAPGARADGGAGDRKDVSIPSSPKVPSSSEGSQDTWLTDRQVAKRYDVSRATIWRWSKKDPAFPRPIKIGLGSARWSLLGLYRYEAELGSGS